MEIWLDTADLELIENAKQMGVLHGVTTNPSIVANSKMGIEDLLEKILALQSGPVTAQVTSNDSEKMIRQGEAIREFSDRLVVKVPVTEAGLKAIFSLSQKNIPVMATAVFDSNQVLLAARAGATYIAPYFSAICEMEREGIDQFQEMLNVLRHYRYPSKLLAASLKAPEQVRQCMELAVDAVTLNKEVFLAFIQNHEETEKRLEKFAKDWKTAKERKRLPL